MAISLVSLPLSIIFRSVLPNLLTITVFHSVEELSCIDGSIAKSDGSISLPYVIIDHFFCNTVSVIGHLPSTGSSLVLAIKILRHHIGVWIEIHLILLALHGRSTVILLSMHKSISVLTRIGIHHVSIHIVLWHVLIHLVLVLELLIHVITHFHINFAHHVVIFIVSLFHVILCVLFLLAIVLTIILTVCILSCRLCCHAKSSAISHIYLLCDLE